MGLFDKLKGIEAEEAAPERKALDLTAPPEEDELIRFYDAFGREYAVPRRQWAEEILPGHLRENWNRTDVLYSIVSDGLNQGFGEAVFGGAKRLYELEYGSVRSTCLYAAALINTQKLDAAENLLETYRQKHGDEPLILANLARVYWERSDLTQAEVTLWDALQLDPNQGTIFNSYMSMRHDRGGEVAVDEALQLLQELPGSWRAAAWVGTRALRSGDLEGALQRFRESLEQAPRPAPIELLQQISAALGSAGHLEELLQLVEPHFEAEAHGLDAGNNLIKAHFDLGHFEAAHGIVQQLYTQDRPDWKENLSYWEHEIAKAGLATAVPTADEPLEFTTITVGCPVWLSQSSPLADLFRSDEPNAELAAGVTIDFVGSSASVPDSPDHVEAQLSDVPGRLSRALPLFLAEQVRFATGAQTQALFPWVLSGSGGFVFSGEAWENEEALRLGDDEGQGEYVVVTHLNCVTQPWAVELRLLRRSDATCIAEFANSIELRSLGVDSLHLAKELSMLVRRKASLQPVTPPPLYNIPSPEFVSEYLLRLEQLLAVRCAATDPKYAGFLYGERDIIDGTLNFSLTHPDNVVARAVLAQLLASMKQVHPHLPPQYTTKLSLLNQQYPLPEPANSVIGRVLAEAID